LPQIDPTQKRNDFFPQTSVFGDFYNLFSRNAKQNWLSAYVSRQDIFTQEKQQQLRYMYVQHVFIFLAAFHWLQFVLEQGSFKLSQQSTCALTWGQFKHP
jgi:hypothetical protein